MEEILKTILYQYYLVYIDDVIVFSKTLIKHYAHLEKVLKLSIQSGVKLHPKKRQFCTS